MKAMVTGGQLMQAIDFDGRSAGELCGCMERTLIAGGNLKRVMAQVMKTFSGLPAAAQERQAYASDAHAAAMEEEAKAAAALEEIKAARAHARLTIEIWRILDASYRAVSVCP